MSQENLPSGFLTRSDKNRTVQPQKIARAARGLKFRIQEVKQLCYLCCENKGLDQLRGFRKLIRTLFSHMQKVDFLMTQLISVKCLGSMDDMSRVMRKPDFCICENKDADQLRGNREADPRLCFRYTDSTIPLLSKSEISSL